MIVQRKSYAVRQSYRRPVQWGFEVVAIDDKGVGHAVGPWHPSQAAAEAQLACITACVAGHGAGSDHRRMVSEQPAD